MSLISRLLRKFQPWGPRPRADRKPARRPGVAVEYLDHRQLLSVNFTGNVPTDFPATTVPGVVVLPNNPNVQHPSLAPQLAPIVKVSGFDINGIRTTYTPADDTLSIGLEQPLSQQPGQPGEVIAGDADNNGNDGTVNPAVLAIEPAFQDFPQFGGSERMGAFLDLRDTGYADVVAGFAIADPRTPKQYQVADAVVNRGAPPAAPDFGTMLANNTGVAFKVNSPSSPNLEMTIPHFSTLYQSITGRALTSTSVIGLGAFGGSGNDIGIGEAFFPEQTFTVGAATPTQPPPPPPVVPPASPPVIINFHENKHINTAHDTQIRVNVLGSSGFNVTQIEPATVTLGGAHPIFSFDRFINNDDWPDATFVFRGTDVKLPAGSTEATVTGDLANGTTFSSSVRVFNRNSSFYTPAQNAGAQQRVLAREARANGFVVVPSTTAAMTTPAASTVTAQSLPTPTVAVPAAPATIKIDSAAPATTGFTRSQRAAARIEEHLNTLVAHRADAHAVVVPTVKVPKAAAGSDSATPRISRRLQASLNRFARQTGAVNVGTGQALAPSGAF